VPPSLDIVLPIRVKRIETLAATEPRTEADATEAARIEMGYEQGRLRAEWEAERPRKKENDRVRQLVESLEKLHGEYEKLLEEHLPDLIQRALTRVFRKHPFTADEINAEVTALLEDMENASRLSLECAPVHVVQLRQKLEECESIPANAKWSLEGNDALEPGEFLLKSDLGDVDGRHISRIRQVQMALEAA
jgi:flagellar biosynthesis/type III secretory pathway protein FliH